MINKLNLGCGVDIRKDCINLDSVKRQGVDVIHDLNGTPYPFKEESFEIIYAFNVLEHLDGEWFKIIRELYRILKKNGKLLIKVPHFTSAVAFIENHRRFFRYRSFESECEQKSMRALDQKESYKFKTIYKRINFIKFPLIYNIPIEWFVNSSRSASLLYENTFLRALFPADSMFFILKK